MNTYMDSTISFETNSLTYELSAGFDFDKDTYYMPCLSFIKDKGDNENELYVSSWDNEAYLIKTLYKKVLIPWNNEKQILDVEAFADLLTIDGVSLEHFLGIEEIIKIGIKKGFFYEYYNRN